MIFRDRASQGAPLPYVVILEAIGVAPLAMGDNGKRTSANELLQVDVWQEWRNEGTGRTSERYSLSGDIARAIHGAKVQTAPQLVFGIRVVNRVRIIEEDANLIHDAITVQLTRRL